MAGYIIFDCKFLQIATIQNFDEGRDLIPAFIDQAAAK